MFSVLLLAMDVLGKLCTLEGNDEVIETGLEPEAYQSLIQVLIVSDVQVIYELRKIKITVNQCFDVSFSRLRSFMLMSKLL